LGKYYIGKKKQNSCHFFFSPFFKAGYILLLSQRSGDAS